MFRMALGEPTAIDPYRAQEIEGIGVSKLLFVGLLQIDAEQQLATAVARAWGSDSSARIWTFHLRDDVLFSNGEQVDAASFVRGLNRALDPAAATETAYHVAGVRGYEQMRSGAVTSLAGAVALDPLTLVFELDKSDFEFDKKTVQSIFSPVPTTAGPAADSSFNSQPVGNGPYRMAEPWRRGEYIRLHKNPHWFGPPVAIEEIHVDILDPSSALDDEYAGFVSGAYDYARVPEHLLENARARTAGTGGFLHRDLPGLHYLLPFCHRPPLNDVWARRAVSCAIDRQQLADDLFSSSREPAGSLLSPWFTKLHTRGLGSPFTDFRPDLARECAERAALAGTIDFAFNTGGGHERWVDAVAAQIRAHLGLEVRTLPMSAADLVAYRTSAQASGMCRAGWAYDYPTPDNLLYPLLHSTCTSPDEDGRAHGDNEGRYANPLFDAAVERARATVDESDRTVRWKRAEGIAMADMALIPLWYRTEYRVFAADRFAHLDLDFFGNPTLPNLRTKVGVS